MNPPRGDLAGDVIGYGSDEWRQGEGFTESEFVPQLGKKYRIATGGYVEALRRSPGLTERCRFFTMFRHPVRRVVSAYYYCRQQKHSWDPLCASSVVDSTQVDLVSFARHWGNYALRQFAMGMVPADDVLRYVDSIVDEDRTLHNVPVDHIPSWLLLKLFLRDKYGGQGANENDDAALSDMLGIVQNTLRDNYTAIGVVEEFDATMSLFDAAAIPGTKWRATFRAQGAANRNDKSETEESAALQQALLSDDIKKYLRLDIVLYDHAVAVFHDMLRRHGIPR